MREIGTQIRGQIHALAARQWGVVSRAQLVRRGVRRTSIDRLLASGRLHRVYPGVYSVMQLDLISVEGWHAAAILAGGKGSRLCAESAAWWAGTAKRPPVIHVGVRHAKKPIKGIRWHRVKGDPVKHRKMPITPLEQIPQECAPRMSLWELKGLLAELEFHHDLGPEALRGRSAKLRKAIAEHTPELAQTSSELEKAYVRFATERRLALPQFQYPLGSSTVDAIYAEQGVVIELDGVKGHSGDRRVLRDHRRDLHRRADGLLPLRYAYAQLVDPRDGDLIEAELLRYGVPQVPFPA